MRILTISALLLIVLYGRANAQCWGCYMSGGPAFHGAYREWPRGWYGWTPGYRYYGYGYFRPFSYWERNPYYRY